MDDDAVGFSLVIIALVFITVALWAIDGELHSVHDRLETLEGKCNP